MKKIALVIGMVVVLVGLVMGGLTLHANAAPTLPLPTVKAWGSSAPGTVTVTGTNWYPTDLVSLYMDTDTDASHYVAVATPGSNGVIVATFMVGPTYIGEHHIIAVQMPRSATATFTITNAQPVDDRVAFFDATFGSKEASQQGSNKVEFKYSAIRHVSLMLSVPYISPGDQVWLIATDGSGTDATLDIILKEGTTMYQFDTSHWYLDGYAPTQPTSGTRLMFDWVVTSIGTRVSVSHDLDN